MNPHPPVASTEISTVPAVPVTSTEHRPPQIPNPRVPNLRIPNPRVPRSFRRPRRIGPGVLRILSDRLRARRPP